MLRGAGHHARRGSTPANKAVLATAALNEEKSPPPAPPVRLKFKFDDEGRVHGQKRGCQPSHSFSSCSSSHTTSSSESEEVNVDTPKLPKTNKAVTGTRNGQAT